MPNPLVRCPDQIKSALLAVIALLVLGQGALAQPAGPELSDQVVTRPSVGLTATLPVGATRRSYQISGRAVDGITLPGMAALVNLHDRQLTTSQSLREVADSIIRDHLRSVSSLEVDPSAPKENAPGLQTAKGQLLSREIREINGWPAEVLYLQLASVGRGEDSAYGYAVFMPTGNSVAMFELQTTEGELAAAKPYFELLVNSTRIVDPEAASATRALGVEAGIAFFQSLTPDDYEDVIKRLGDDWRYERFYRAASNGSDQDAVELGYRRTRYVLGKRSDLKAGGQRGNSRPEDRQRGYLIFQEVRMLLDDQVVDLAAGYFMSPDRSQEMWSIRQSVKSAKFPEASSSSVVVETGVRNRADLSISRVSEGGPVQTLNPAIAGSGYVSRAEVLLLPHLLMHKQAQGSYRCYAYNQIASRVTLREDTLEAPTAERKAWEYISSPSETSSGQTSSFDSNRELVRAEGADEQVWEPISLKRLYDLWREKKLPLK